MRISESKLRRVIRQVILESDAGDLSDTKLFSDFLNAVKDKGFDPEILMPIKESFFQNKKLIKESFKYKNWNQYLKDLEKQNIDIDAKFNNLSKEKKLKVLKQAEAIKAAKGSLKEEKIRACMEMLGFSAIIASMLMVLISVLCVGIIPAAIASKLMSVIGGKTIVGLFIGGWSTADAFSGDANSATDDRIRSDRESAYYDPESPLHKDYLKK